MDTIKITLHMSLAELEERVRKWWEKDYRVWPGLCAAFALLVSDGLEQQDVLVPDIMKVEIQEVGSFPEDFKMGYMVSIACWSGQGPRAPVGYFLAPDRYYHKIVKSVYRGKHTLRYDVTVAGCAETIEMAPNKRIGTVARKGEDGRGAWVRRTDKEAQLLPDVVDWVLVDGRLVLKGIDIPVSEEDAPTETELSSFPDLPDPEEWHVHAVGIETEVGKSREYMLERSALRAKRNLRIWTLRAQGIIGEEPWQDFSEKELPPEVEELKTWYEKAVEALDAKFPKGSEKE